MNDMIQIGQVTIGEDFYVGKKRQYGRWAQAWVREAIQNSVDAGARNVTIKILSRKDGNFNVIVEDDGKGMNEEVLFGKFLTLGGTTKDGSSTTGGFGTAKELLLFPHLSYEIKTSDISLKGKFGTFEHHKVGEKRKGVRLRVVMSKDDVISVEDATTVIERSQIPKVRFVIEFRETYESKKTSQVVEARQRKGKTLRKVGYGKADICAPKTSSYEYSEDIWVRVRGLYMFSVALGESIKGRQPIMEITANSVEVLTDNRDGLRDPCLKYEFESFLQELSADRSSALRPKNKIRMEVFEGRGKFVVSADNDIESLLSPEALSAKKEDEAKMAIETRVVHEEKEEDTAWGSRKGAVELVDDARIKIVKSVCQPLTDLPGGALGALRPNEKAAEILIESVPFQSGEEIEKAMKPFSWEPDFMIMNDTDMFKTPRTIKPEKMSLKAKNLARFWAEVVRFVFMQLKCSAEFGVGWVLEFGDEGRGYPAASYMRHAGNHWILMNPYRTWKTVDEKSPRNMKSSDLFSTSSSDDRAAIYAMAVHEVTHVESGLVYHNEDFASALTKNIQKCLPGYSKVSKLAKALKSSGNHVELNREIP